MKKKRWICIFSMLVLLSACATAKSVENEVPATRIKERHIAVLESTKTYEEMTAQERTAALEVCENYWEELSEEDQLKYNERKEEILQTKQEAVEKWREEKEREEAKKAEKENIMNEASEILSDYNVFSIDVTTSIVDESPILNIDLILDSYKTDINFRSLEELSLELNSILSHLADTIEFMFMDSSLQIIAVYYDGKLELL